MFTYFLLYIELRELCLLIDIGNRKTSVFFMLSLHLLITHLLVVCSFFFCSKQFCIEFKKAFLKIIRSNILNYMYVCIYMYLLVVYLVKHTGSLRIDIETNKCRYEIWKYCNEFSN